MEKFTNFLAAILLKVFNVRLNVSCATFYGEPECPEEILK
ncbi:AgrD family cyclic lactone autoinducer peptide [Clostridium saccharoperbutylacetonicum]